MGKFIVELRNPADDSDRRLVIWSTVVDAPVTYGMARSQFEDYYREQYGAAGLRELPDRMSRVDAVGTSEHGAKDWLATITFNRAGPEECMLSPAELWSAYCEHACEVDS